MVQSRYNIPQFRGYFIGDRNDGSGIVGIVDDDAVTLLPKREKILAVGRHYVIYPFIPYIFFVVSALDQIAFQASLQGNVRLRM